MFDSTLSEQPLSSFSVGNNALESNNLGTDTFSNLTPNNQRFPNINLNVDEYINGHLEQATTLDNRLADDESALIFSLSGMTNTGAEKLTTQIKRDPLTGLSAEAHLVNNLKPANDGDRASTLSPPSPSSVGRTRIVRGNLRANVFRLQPGFRRTVFSGNGNVDFGRGARDLIYLPSISSRTVRFNFARIRGGGLLYNPGNGVRVFDAMTLRNGRQILFEGIDRIRFADRIINLSVRPNDPYFNSQWNLHMMGVQNAWRFTRGSAGVLVGIQDTGLGTDLYDNLHPDIDDRTTYIDTGNYKQEYGFLNDTTSHGTAVQGIIAADTNNRVGMSGINWNSSVYNIDVLRGNDYNDEDIAEATQNMINFAKSHRRKLIINMSLTYSRSYAFERLIANNQKNALFVIATGNDNSNSLSYPAWLAYYYRNVIAVGASWGTYDVNGNVRTPGRRISYPGWWGSNYGAGITLMGPSEVVSTTARWGFLGNFDYESKFNGTSAATPNVTGVASLIWSANRNLSAGQIKRILSQTAFDLGRRGYDRVYGSGFVNADAAVRRAIALKRLFPASNSASSQGNTFASLNGGVMSGFNDSVASASNVTAVQSLNVSDAIELKKNDTTVIPSISSTDMQATPAYSANHDVITGMSHHVELTGVTRQKSSRLLVAGLDLYSDLGKNADELMLG
jgi:serine protease